jgi:hypothetical protein
MTSDVGTMHSGQREDDSGSVGARVKNRWSCSEPVDQHDANQSLMIRRVYLAFIRDTLAWASRGVATCRQVISSSGYAVLFAGFIALTTAGAAEQNGSSTVATSEVAGSLVQVPELPEGSGVAASKRSPGLFWVHNDSDSRRPPPTSPTRRLPKSRRLRDKSS